MNQKHVTSLDLSKQLAEAGIVIESEHVWCHGDLIPIINIILETAGSEIYPAPLATELLERLPSEMTNDKGDWSCSLTLINAFDFWVVTYQDGELNTVGEQIESKYLPDALALLLIRLTKDGLI